MRQILKGLSSLQWLAFDMGGKIKDRERKTERESDSGKGARTHFPDAVDRLSTVCRRYSMAYAATSAANRTPIEIARLAMSASRWRTKSLTKSKALAMAKKKATTQRRMIVAAPKRSRL